MCDIIILQFSVIASVIYTFLGLVVSFLKESTRLLDRIFFFPFFLLKKILNG